MDVHKRKVVQLVDFTESSSSSVTTLARPKAKVNTSALNRNTARSTVAKNGTSSPTLRPASPTKMPTKITASVSGSAHPKVKLTRPATSHSTTGTPNSYQHPMAHSLSQDSARLRRASMTFTQPFPSHDPPVASTSDTSLADCPPKIKSKISRVAMQQEPVARPRNRTPSISSALSAPPEPTFYPITTATSAANPHRFAVRSPPTRHFHQTFSPPRSEVITSSIFATKEDLQPPNSPPTSAVSISSRSSVSKSSLSYADSTTDSPSPSIHPVLLERDVSSPTEVLEGAAADGEHKVRAEAKSNRKIADLEITNKSLLAINASLEATKHRQAKEIRELRRKLRESRLILPPRAYRAVQSSPSGSEESDESNDDEGEADEQGSTDDTYARIQHLITDLLDSGKRALESVPADFVQGIKGGAKVLTAEEVRHWRDSSGSPDNRPLSPARVAVPDSDSGDSDHLESEEEVESMISVLSSSPTAPSILVTKSP